MIDFFLDKYKQYFKLTGTKYCLHYFTLNGRCVFSDPKSCDPCIGKGKRLCDESSFKQIFLIETDGDIICVNIEDFMNQFVGTKADSQSKCDLMLYGETKVTFLDMYCGQEKFVLPYDTTHTNGRVEHKIGKLATVRNQIISTINKLCEVPKIEQALQSFKDKEGLFAYRSKTNHLENPSQEKPLERNINIFIKAAEAASNDLHTLLTHGFVFKTVIYPEVYVW